MKHFYKKLCSGLLAVVMLLTMCGNAFAATISFPDISGHWAEKIIDELAADGIIAGYEDGKCHPDNSITRGEFATLVARFFELTAERGDTSGFTDVAGHWAAKNICGLTEKNIILPTDYGDTFEPNKAITRIEMIRMMVRAIGKTSEAEETTGPTDFVDDSDIEEADSGYVSVAEKYKIVVGFPDGKVRPYCTATRAEGFAMLKRMMSAYEEIQKAEEEKPSKPTNTGGGSYVYPTPTVEFSLPETAYTGAEITVAATTKNASSVVWTLTKGGEAISVDGFSKEGGSLKLEECGVYTLTATAANPSGKTAECQQTVTVYPIAGLAFTLPVTTHTDTAIPVDLLSENIGDASVAWNIERNGLPVSLSEAANGTLDNTGGSLRFIEDGEYTVTASVTDALGKECSFSQMMKVYPTASIELELSEITHTDTDEQIVVSGEHLESLPIVWTVAKDGAEIDPAEILDGELTENGGTVRFTAPGAYTLTVTATDETGRSYTAADRITVYPVGTVGFFMPSFFHIGDEVQVEATITELADNTPTWSLTRNGESVSLDDYLIGTLTEQGGSIQIREKGDYVLTASFVDGGSREYSYQQAFTVYPIARLAFALPATAHTDTAVPVDLLSENIGDAAVVWSIERDGQPVELSEAANGSLNDAGGVLQFVEAGEYTVTATLTDALGKEATCAQTVKVYPVVSIALHLPDATYTDQEEHIAVSGTNLESLPILWTVSKDGAEVDLMEAFSGELTDEGGTIRFTDPGTYTLTAVATDETGRSYTASDSITAYPVGAVGFFMPTIFHTDDTVKVEATIAELSDNTLTWTLTRNGERVDLNRYISGALDETGGNIQVCEKGSYELTASFTDIGGRVYSYQQAFTVYPLPVVDFSLPTAAWTDTSIPITVESTDTEDVTVEWLVDNTYGYQDWNTYIDGRLRNDGGTIRFKRAGSYEIVARITDATGRVFLYETNAKCEVQPVLRLSINMPELFRMDKTVDIRTNGNNNILPVEWSLEKDGETVELWDCFDGTLNAYGGKGRFQTHGDYVLTASVTDVLGRTFAESKDVKVYPIATYSVAMPEACHIGTPFTVTGEGEYLDGCIITWTLTKDGESAEYEGTLGDDGGEIAILETGSYKLTATIADPYGNVYTAADSVEITNTAPDAPTITIDMDYSDTLNTYTPECQVKVNISLAGNDADGDSFTLSYAEDSVQGGYFGVGTYTVKAQSTDQWGLTSEWAEKSFTISAEKPDVDLFSELLGSNDGVAVENVDFDLEISRGGPNQIFIADYHNPDHLDSISKLSISEDGSTINGWFAFGRHILLVKVIDVFGNTAYGARPFIVSNEENQDKTSITSLSTTITEEGLYNGSDLLAYIGGFTFNIPAISGHNTGCKDLIEIFGVTEDGTQELVLTFHTNNGYVYAHSGGTYEYTAANRALTTANWSGWEQQKYTKMIFHYEMTSGHESCIANATEGLSYRVRYSFIPEQIEHIESLFRQFM